MKPLFLAGVPKKMRPLYVPDFTADSILDVDFLALQKLGVKHVIIDLDLTLRKKMTRKIEPAIVEYIHGAVKKYDFKSVSIASNNMLNLRHYALQINATIFQPFWKGLWLARKPSKPFYQRIISQLKVKPHECVMIGDKLHGDVFGGNSAGMYTVLVKPKGRDYWYDRILLTRLRERYRLQKIKLPKIFKED